MEESRRKTVEGAWPGWTIGLLTMVFYSSNLLLPELVILSGTVTT